MLADCAAGGRKGGVLAAGGIRDIYRVETISITTIRSLNVSAILHRPELQGTSVIARRSNIRSVSGKWRS